jgi:hypothetical protein
MRNILPICFSSFASLVLSTACARQYQVVIPPCKSVVYDVVIGKPVDLGNTAHLPKVSGMSSGGIVLYVTDRSGKPLNGFSAYATTPSTSQGFDVHSEANGTLVFSRLPVTPPGMSVSVSDCWSDSSYRFQVPILANSVTPVMVVASPKDGGVSARETKTP